MAKCPKCQSENGAGASLCAQCGQPLRGGWWRWILRLFGIGMGRRVPSPEVESESDAHLREAVAEYDEAIRLNPQDAAVYKNRAAAYEAMAQYQRALEDLDEAIRLDPQFVGAYNSRASVYYNLGQYQRSIEDVGEAIRLDSNLAGAYAGRALAYTHLGSNEEARKDVERAVELGFERGTLEAEIEELAKRRWMG